MAIGNAITFVLKLKGAAAFAGEAKKASDGLTGIQKATSIGKKVVGGAAAFIAARKTIGFLDQGIKNAQKAKQEWAVLNKQISNTGRNLDDVKGVTSEIWGKSNFGGSELRALAGQTTKFTNVRGAQFDDLMRMSADFAVSQKKDLGSAGHMLGKALNDPVRGIAQLRRAGVSFTAQQEKQIKAMAETGDMAGAQKVMLDELYKAHGGAAEAAMTPADRLRKQLAKLQTDLGARLLPVVETVTRKVGDFVAWFNRGGPQVRVFIGVLGALATAFGVYKVIQTATKMMAAFNVVLSMNPVGIVIVAVAALTAGLITAYKRSETFRNVVRSAMGGARAAVQWVINKVQALINKLQVAWDKAKEVIEYVQARIPGTEANAERKAAAQAGLEDLLGRSSPFVGRARGGRVQPWERITLVGEQGPELVSLPTGSVVHPNGTGPSMGDRIVELVNVFQIDGRELARQVRRVNLQETARA